MLALAAATVLFAAAHWTSEYACQYLYCFHGLQPLTYAYSRAANHFENSMFIETATIVVCAIPFLIVQGLYRPDTAVPVRPGAWLAAILAGVIFCLTRWVIDFAFNKSLPESIDFVVALILSTVLAAAVSRYRWPRQPQT